MLCLRKSWKKRLSDNILIVSGNFCNKLNILLSGEGIQRVALTVSFRKFVKTVSLFTLSNRQISRVNKVGRSGKYYSGTLNFRNSHQLFFLIYRNHKEELAFLAQV